MSEKTLVKKLAKVMKEVKYIEKRGYNKFHKYNYATESDVSEKVREILAEENVIMMPDVVEYSTREHINQRGNKEYIATVKMKFTFIDGGTGEELSIHSIGEGQDAGDKAVYKAITGATKYALMKAFMIPTGDDPEADDGVDKRNNQDNQANPQKASEKQLNFVDNLLNKNVNENFSKRDLYEHLKQKMNTTVEMENWTSQQASLAIKILQGDGK